MQLQVQHQMKNKIMDYLKKNKIGLIFISIVFLVISFFYIKVQLKYSEINKNGIIGIGKFVEYKRYPKSRDYFFEYYKNGNKIRDLIKNPPGAFHKKLGSFFEIKYVEEYDDIIVNYDKEITDTIAILNAGFSREDLR